MGRVQIRIYALAKDYDHVAEIQVALESNGNMTLARIADQLEERRTCQVTQYLWIALHDLNRLSGYRPH